MALQQRTFFVSGSSTPLPAQQHLVLLGGTGIEIKRLRTSDLKDVRLDDAPAVFRAVDHYACEHGHVGGFPTFVSDEGVLGGVLAVLASGGGVERQRVPRAELWKDKYDPLSQRLHHCRVVHDYARKVGFRSGVPTFVSLGGDDVVLLFPHGTEVWVRSCGFDVEEEDVRGRFRGAHQAAVQRGFATGFATGHRHDWHRKWNRSTALSDCERELNDLLTHEGWTITSIHVVGGPENTVLFTLSRDR